MRFSFLVNYREAHTTTMLFCGLVDVCEKRFAVRCCFSVATIAQTLASKYLLNSTWRHNIAGSFRPRYLTARADGHSLPNTRQV